MLKAVVAVPYTITSQSGAMQRVFTSFISILHMRASGYYGVIPGTRDNPTIILPRHRHPRHRQ